MKPSTCDAYHLALGRRIKALRERRGLTQEQMAERGFNLRHYQRVEAGQPVTTTTLYRLAKALGVKPGRLLP